VPLRPAELDVFDWASNICSHETSALYVQVQSAGSGPRKTLPPPVFLAALGLAVVLMPVSQS
jgi:hypothetical protein